MCTYATAVGTLVRGRRVDDDDDFKDACIAMKDSPQISSISPPSGTRKPGPLCAIRPRLSVHLLEELESGDVLIVSVFTNSY